MIQITDNPVTLTICNIVDVALAVGCTFCPSKFPGLRVVYQRKSNAHIIFCFVFVDMLFTLWVLDTISNTRLQQKVLSSLLTGVL